LGLGLGELDADHGSERSGDNGFVSPCYDRTASSVLCIRTLMTRIVATLVWKARTTRTALGSSSRNLAAVKREMSAAPGVGTQQQRNGLVVIGNQ